MTDANMMLEPCPFCGGEAKCNGHPKGILGQIYCSNEECFGPRTTAFTKQDSIVQWNTRAAAIPPPQREEIEPDDSIKDASDLLKQYIEETKAAGDERPMAIYRVMHALSYAMREHLDSGIICVCCGKPAVGKCEGAITDENSK